MTKRNRNKVFDNRRTKKEDVNPSHLSKYAEKTGNDDYRLDWFHPDPQQAEIVQSMVWKDLTIVDGKSGTGKTTTALWKALQMLKAGDFRKLLFVKTPVETGDDQIGFLSGDKNDKLSTHFETTKRIFLQFMNSGKLETDIGNGKIELTIPNYLLGATWDNSIVIIDEAQLMKSSTVKLLLERAGENTRIIILGDADQRYAIKGRDNGLEDLITRVIEFGVDGDEEVVIPVEDFIGFVELTSDNNHRSRLSKFITEIY